MTWTRETLRAVAEGRGEHLPKNAVLELAVLAHERVMRRTEERYPIAKAKQELQELLERLDYKLPSKRAKEFTGLTELRQQLEQQHKLTARAQEAEPDPEYEP